MIFIRVGIFTTFMLHQRLPHRKSILSECFLHLLQWMLGGEDGIVWSRDWWSLEGTGLTFLRLLERNACLPTFTLLPTATCSFISEFHRLFTQSKVVLWEFFLNTISLSPLLFVLHCHKWPHHPAGGSSQKPGCHLLPPLIFLFSQSHLKPLSKSYWFFLQKYVSHSPFPLPIFSPVC